MYRNHKTGFYIMILFFVLVLNQSFLHAKQNIRPYLQAVTATSIYVLAKSESVTPMTVEYGQSRVLDQRVGTEKIDKTDATPEIYIHKIKLTGLKPDSQYYYRVTQGTNHSKNYNFWTSANPGRPFRFAWMADCRSGIHVHDQIAKRIKEAKPRFSIYGGDLAVRGSYRAFEKEFFRSAELDLIANVPFFNTVGNHEGWTQNTKAFTEAPDSPTASQGYYSFDYGDLHVLVLNTETDKSNSKLNSQYQFAKEDLHASKKPWKIVVSHIPAYCAGGHGKDKTMQRFTKKIFEPEKIDMVISGHSHFYQHNLVNGIHHLVIGSAGAPLHSPQNASYTVKSIKDHNYAIVDLEPTKLHMVVYNDHGKVLDVIDLKK
jgi:predicted phosphodiesterase